MRSKSLDIAGRSAIEIYLSLLHMFLGPVMVCPLKIKDFGKSLRTLDLLRTSVIVSHVFSISFFMLVEVLCIKMGFGFTYKSTRRFVKCL